MNTAVLPDVTRGEASGQMLSRYDLARPFYFMVPFWGERYRQYLVDRLLPSLLAPHNLPLLRADQGHRLLMATTRGDWEAIAELPIMKRLREHAEPTFIEIPSPAFDTPPGSTNAIRHQDVALRLLAESAFAGGVYGSLHWPDTIVSDGMVASLLQHARQGHRLVLCPALRHTEELAVAELGRLGYLSSAVRPSDTVTPINVPQRVLADLMVRFLHPEMSIYQEGARGQPPLAPFRYWQIPDRGGIILHTFHGSPVLMDYGAVRVTTLTAQCRAHSKTSMSRATLVRWASRSWCRIPTSSAS